MKSVLTKHQVKTLTAHNVTVNGETFKKVVCNICFDDRCGNGHNSFSVTGDFYLNQHEINRDDPSMCGCCHDELVQVFPEIKHLIKWHLCSTDSPMHYIANTLYHARDCDTEGKRPGDPTKYARFVLLGNSNYPHNYSTSFMDFLENAKKSGWILKPKAIQHKKDGGYNFSDKFTIEGFDCEWYQCPFDDLNIANGFCDTANNHGFEIIKKPIEWAQAVEPNIKAARNAAIWPDATLEQLQNRELLDSRLPALLNEFKSDVESLGFVW